MTLPRSYTDALERSLALVIQGFQQRADLALAEARLSVAELTAQLAASKAEVVGLREEMKAHAGELVARAVEALPQPVEPDLSGFLTREEAIQATQNLADDAAEVAERVRALEERPTPEPVDLSGFVTRDDLAEASRSILASMPTLPDIPEAPDLSGFATRADVDAVRDAMPAAPDLSGFVTRDDLAEVRAAIPTLPEPLDLSGFATREDVDAVRAAMPTVPEARDWTPEINAASERAEQAEEAATRAVEQMAERLAQHPGVFPVVRAWSDEGVSYAGDIRTHEGELWQAQRDTGKAPPHEDWALLVKAGDKGEPGDAGRSVQLRGTYDPAGDYAALDMVTLNGSSFTAKRDDPGPCPGEGWQLAASAGSKGKSIPGEQGKPGPSVAALFVDEERTAVVLTMEDGATFEADLYPLLEKVAR